MRYFICIISFLLMTISASAQTKGAKELAAILRSMIEQQSVNPDSIMPNIAKLERRKNLITDPTERAVNEAALGYLYQENANINGATDYREKSARCFSNAMADLNILHRAKISQWLPLLSKGNDDDIFDNDMLMVVWRESEQTRMYMATEMKGENNMPKMKNLIDFYKAQGNRAAALELIIDTLVWTPREKKYETLLALKEEYAKQKNCGIVYYNLAQCEKDTARMIDWLDEGVRLYPKYRKKSDLQNYKRMLTEPSVMMKLNTQRPYPGKDYKVTFSVRNVTEIMFSVLQMHSDYDVEEYSEAMNESQYLAQHTTMVSTQKIVCHEHKPWETFKETIDWKAPQPGKYAILLSSKTKEKLAKSDEPYSIEYFITSRLHTAAIELPGETVRIAVSDAQSGAPVEGATVKLFRTNDKDTTYTKRLVTRQDGTVDITPNDYPNTDRHRSMSMHVELGDDRHLPDETIYRPNVRLYSDDREQKTNIYTDRSIYRPGQTVHVGGVESKRKKWTESVVANNTHKIDFYNAKHEIEQSVDVETDSMGVFSTDFTLPEDCLTGTYYIYIDDRMGTHVKVEEYKRPTFEIRLDQPRLSSDDNRVILSGTATSYSGVPVRGARVTGKYNWKDIIFYWRRKTQKNRLELNTDTVTTDENGHFEVTIPYWDDISDNEPYSYYNGKVLFASFDITSAAGETHNETLSNYISKRSLSVLVNLPGISQGEKIIDKDKHEDWSIILNTSTGKTIEGDLQMKFMRDGKVVHECVEKSGENIKTDFLGSLASGRYDLSITATAKRSDEEKAIIDTASASMKLILFSRSDSRPVIDTALWFYAPDTDLQRGKSCKVQIGSSHDAYIYVTLACNDKVIEDKLLHVNDSIVNFDVNYDETYGDGVTLVVATVNQNRMLRQHATFYAPLPDKQLKHRWITFRDHLLPGQKETWQLELTRPDGKPATANLMASLYDASLDAIYGHGWSFTHNLQRDIAYYHYSPFFHDRSFWIWKNFELYPIKDKAFFNTTFDSELFINLPYGYLRRGATGSVKMSTKGGVRTRVSEAYTDSYAGPVANALYLQEKVAATATAAGTESASLELESLDEANTIDDVTLNGVGMRENFDETAFFMPSLRTDKNGKVSISFQLPESLTTWRLLGLAHTQDMLTTILNEKVVAQKNLMAQVMMPRFLRQGDKATIAAEIHNIGTGGEGDATSGKTEKGIAVLTILDAKTEKVLSRQKVHFTLKAKTDTTYIFPFNVPANIDMLICRWEAKGTTCSDGEQHYLPSLSTNEWITDSRALCYYAPGTYEENIKKMFDVRNATNKRLTVEYVDNPVWYAVQALPSLAWPKYEDAFSLVTAYYSGCMSDLMVKTTPQIAETIKLWKSEQKESQGKLSQNENLKNIAVSETPWAAEAEAEETRISRLSTLLDESTQKSLQKEYLDRIRNLQHTDGSISWYPGMTGSYYLTREVAFLLTRLNVLTGKTASSILGKAIDYIREDKPTTLCAGTLRYLYILKAGGVELNKQDRHNADSLIKVLRKHPEQLSLEERALASIVLLKSGHVKDARKYLETVKKFLVTDKDGLTYFNFPQGSSRSIDRKLHILVQAMEALSTFCTYEEENNVKSTENRELLRGMQKYLLKQKRTTGWSTPMNTANAIYALLLGNSCDISNEQQSTVAIRTKSGINTLSDSSKPFGYIRHQQEVEDGNTPQSLKIVKKDNKESWGAIYAQYQAPASEIRGNSAELEIKVDWKDANLKVGDHTKVRYTIVAHNDFEYVHIHAPRPACFEPSNQLSGYNYSNGLGFYRAVKDASTDYFIDRLPRGTYTLEEDVFVDRSGVYTTGISTVECLYAPEYKANTKDARITCHQ